MIRREAAVQLGCECVRSRFIFFSRLRKGFDPASAINSDNRQLNISQNLQRLLMVMFCSPRSILPLGLR